MSDAGPTTLGAAARFFWAKPTPRLISAYLAVTAVARLLVAPLGWRDLAVPVVILALEPFTEWVIHVVVLHWKPRQVAGRTIDLYAGRSHRAHHADPRNLQIVFVPFRLLLVQVPALLLLAVLVLGGPTGLTVGVASMAMLLAYEWTHFLVHAPYVPRTGWYRSRWRAHRLHHFRNERYWFGVTLNLGDRVLGTFPEKADVEPSATVRTLGIDASPL